MTHTPFVSLFSWQIAIFSEVVKNLMIACRATQAMRLLQVSLASFALDQK
jgi:hypothetical protein